MNLKEIQKFGHARVAVLFVKDGMSPDIWEIFPFVSLGTDKLFDHRKRSQKFSLHPGRNKEEIFFVGDSSNEESPESRRQSDGRSQCSRDPKCLSGRDRNRHPRRIPFPRRPRRSLPEIAGPTRQQIRQRAPESSASGTGSKNSWCCQEPGSERRSLSGQAFPDHDENVQCRLPGPHRRHSE